MKINIDGKDIHVKDTMKNIVEIADENGITITAPCFRNKKTKGCCSACIIEVEGQQRYACGTRPTEGMKIIYKRDDLELLRNERLKKYAINTEANVANCCGSASEKLFKSAATCNCSGDCC